MTVTEEYALTVCSQCDQSWVTGQQISTSQRQFGRRAHHMQTEIRCPICKHDHAVESLKLIETSEDRDALVALRSEYQAHRAGREGAFEQTAADSHSEQKQKAEAYLNETKSVPGFDGGEIDVSEKPLIGSEKYSEEAERYLEEKSERESEFFGDRADEVVGTVGDSEHNIPEDVGENWEPVSVGVERGDKSNLPTNVDNTGSLSFAEPTDVNGCEMSIGVENVETTIQLHQRLFGIGSELQQQVIGAADELFDSVDRDVTAFWGLLDKIADVDTDPPVGGLYDLLVRQAVVDGRFKDAEPGVHRLTSEMGASNTFVSTPIGFDAVYAGPFRLLRAASVTPAVMIRLPSGLFNKSRNTIDNVIEYITELSRGCDVTLVATSRIQNRIWLDYGDELPADVSEGAKPRCVTRSDDTDPEGVAKSLVGVDIEIHSTKAKILRIVHEGRVDAAFYGVGSELVTDTRLDVGRSRISQVVDDLAELGCVNKHEDKNSYVTLTKTGKYVIDELDGRAGRQTGISGSEEWGDNQSVSDPLNSNADTCNHGFAREGGGGHRQSTQQTTQQTAPQTAQQSLPTQPNDSQTADCIPDHVADTNRNHSKGLSQLNYLSQFEHEALFASAPDGGFVLDGVPSSTVNRDDQFDAPTITVAEDNRDPIYSYNEKRDELVVGGQFHSPLQIGVTITRSLLSEQAFRDVFTPKRLGGFSDSGSLEGLLSGLKDVLRNKSCLGWLRDEYDAEGFINRLKEARDTLLYDDLNKKRQLDEQRRRGDDEYDHDQYIKLCVQIMRDCHGLIGTVTAMCDYLGVDLHRTIRLPGGGYNNLDQGKPGVTSPSASVTGLTHWLLRANTISSKYGAYRQSRMQFEDREEKREMVGGTPNIDRTDAVGSQIGSWSVVGHGAEKLQSDIEWAFNNPEEFDLEHQDDMVNYANWVVDIPITTEFDRNTAHKVVRRMLGRRNLQSTRMAVTLLHAFCDSPHDVAYALYYGLSSEDGREIRIDEVRRALTQLSPTRILPSSDNSSTKSKVVHTLLAATNPLSQAELCDRAGVSTASFAGHGDLQSHRDELEAFGIIHETDAGWVVALPYEDIDVGGSVDEPVTGVPWYAIVEDGWSDRKLPSGHREEGVQGVLYEAIIELEDGDMSNTDHPVFGLLYGRLTEDSLTRLLAVRPRWESVIKFVVAIRECGLNTIGSPSYDPDEVCINGSSTSVEVGRLPPQTKMTEFGTSETATAD